MGSWIVDGVKDNFCTNSNVTGPSNQKAWTDVQNIASQLGVTLSLGTCQSKGYNNLVKTYQPKTFNKFGYTVEWNGKVWSK